ncbi:hypothetical protein DDV84_08755, partial [Campylobacter jejuni]|uniref:hypothetical protein n=1 Tax=Campylobacter jejuni TaxID=197 RepID=UPI000D58398E
MTKSIPEPSAFLTALTPMYNPDGGFNYIPGTNAQPPVWNGTDTATIGSQNYYNAVMNGSLLNT